MADWKAYLFHHLNCWYKILKNGCNVCIGERPLCSQDFSQKADHIWRGNQKRNSGPVLLGHTFPYSIHFFVFLPKLIPKVSEYSFYELKQNGRTNEWIWLHVLNFEGAPSHVSITAVKEFFHNFFTDAKGVKVPSETQIFEPHK